MGRCRGLDYLDIASRQRHATLTAQEAQQHHHPLGATHAVLAGVRQRTATTSAAGRNPSSFARLIAAWLSAGSHHNFSAGSHLAPKFFATSFCW
jgi:hypothetical protein